MSAFSEAKITGQKFSLPIDTIEAIAAPIIWQWYEKHQDETIFTVQRRIFGIPLSYSLKVRDCKPLLERILGSEGILPGVPT